MGLEFAFKLAPPLRRSRRALEGHLEVGQRVGRSVCGCCDDQTVKCREIWKVVLRAGSAKARGLQKPQHTRKGRNRARGKRREEGAGKKKGRRRGEIGRGRTKRKKKEGCVLKAQEAYSTRSFGTTLTSPCHTPTLCVTVKVLLLTPPITWKEEKEEGEKDRKMGRKNR